MALPIGPLPFTLTNGTLADANQVMANFNTLLNGVNGLAPLSSAIVGGTSNVSAGLATAGTTVTVTADSVTVGTALNGTSYTLTSYSQSFNGGTTGAGGMDTGTLPTSGFVAIYAIYNPTAPTISILGKNAAVSAPTVYNGANMPAGYTASALLGVWPTNATPALVAGYVRGKTFAYSGSKAVLTASSTNQASPVSLSIATAVPPNANSFWGDMNITTNASFSGGAVSANFGPDSNVGISLGVFQTGGTGQNLFSTLPPIAIATSQVTFYSTVNVSANATITIVLTAYTIP